MATKADIITALGTDTGWTNIKNTVSDFAPGGKTSKDFYIKTNATTKKTVGISLISDTMQVVYQCASAPQVEVRAFKRMAAALSAAEIVTFLKAMLA